ncbi:hypothetical protein ABKV19_026588 [Rosa sericea]
MLQVKKDPLQIVKVSDKKKIIVSDSMHKTFGNIFLLLFLCLLLNIILFCIIIQIWETVCSQIP